MVIPFDRFIAATSEELYRWGVGPDEGCVSLDLVFDPDVRWPPSMTFSHWVSVWSSAVRRSGVVPPHIAIRMIRDPDPRIRNAAMERLAQVYPVTRELHDVFHESLMGSPHDQELVHLISAVSAFLEARGAVAREV